MGAAVTACGPQDVVVREAAPEADIGIGAPTLRAAVLTPRWQPVFAELIELPDTSTACVGAGCPAPVDAGAADAGVVDAGVVDAGVVDAGAVDAGALDAGPRDAGTSEWSGFGPGAQLSAHTRLGLPSAAAVGAPADWLLVKTQYVASYDTTRKVPRWVSWELTASWLGTAPRSTYFRSDALLPAGTPQAYDSDYTNSGYDRGHLCPSADRTLTPADNLSTFTLTNVVPQTHQSNAGPWETLESESRTLALAARQLTIVAGPVFGATSVAIGSGVAVPLATFKVVVVNSAPGDAVTASTRVIAVIVPNTTSASGNWRSYRVTVRDIERSTGLNLLSDLPQALQDTLETRLDAQ
jgi:endonuclease G